MSQTWKAHGWLGEQIAVYNFIIESLIVRNRKFVQMVSSCHMNN